MSLADHPAKNHEALAAKVEELTTAVKVSGAAAGAAARTAKVTPLKGITYAEGVHAVMHGIAAGLGDEYADTSSATGAISRCRKGDGVLTGEGGAARVVLEMTDSVRTGWNAYLDEAERNREAAASLGLVRDPSQSGGHSIRCLGSRRIVMTFNPASDDPDLLRTVVHLLRVSAIAASSRRGVEGLDTAEEKIGEAQELVKKINCIRKAAGSIRKGAETIDRECGSVQTGIDRLLSEALTALSGVTVDAPARALVDVGMGTTAGAA